MIISLNQEDINASLGAWASGKRSPMFNQASATVAPEPAEEIRTIDMSAANDYSSYSR